MQNLLCWTKCWIYLNAPVSPNILKKKKKYKNTCWICLKWSSSQQILVYYPTFKFQHHFECLFLCFQTFESQFVCFFKNNKRWSYSFGSQFYSTTVAVTVAVTFSSQWHSCRTHFGSPFGLQPLTPEICFGGSQFLSSS